MYTGPKTINNGLVYGYDTGLPVNTNFVGSRFFPGEPTTNATPLTNFYNTSNWAAGGWSGSHVLSSDYDNTLEFTATNGWRTFAIDHGITSGGTVRVSFEYRLKSQETSNIYGLVLNGLNLGNYHNNLGNISNADLEDSLANGWKSYTGSFTANNNTYGSKLAIGLRGSDTAGLSDTMYVRKLQVEQKSHSTPYTETSRGNTASLIDLKRTNNIDVSNMSFDSISQPVFDGTDDILNTGLFSGRNPSTDVFTIEAIVKSDTTSGNHMWVDASGNGNNQRLYCGHVATGTSTALGIQNSGWSHSIPSDTDYHHYVITMNGSTATLYNNTFAHSSKNYTSYTLSGQINVGGRSGYRWNGEIPVFKIYDKVLTTAEITQNYNAYKNRFNI